MCKRSDVVAVVLKRVAPSVASVHSAASSAALPFISCGAVALLHSNTSDEIARHAALAANSVHAVSPCHSRSACVQQRIHSVAHYRSDHDAASDRQLVITKPVLHLFCYSTHTSLISKRALCLLEDALSCHERAVQICSLYILDKVLKGDNTEDIIVLASHITALRTAHCKSTNMIIDLIMHNNTLQLSVLLRTCADEQ
eukprot:19211-Heterococcus_DN1.PRE.3